MRYLVVVEPTPAGGWCATAPDFGLAIADRSPHTAARRLVLALRVHLDQLRDQGEPPPAARARAFSVEIAPAGAPRRGRRAPP